MNWNKIADLSEPLLIGAITTVQLTVGAFLVAIILGLVLALIRLTGIRVVNWLIDAYVEIFRNTPVLAQLFILYFGLAYVGIRIPSFPAAIIGLGLNGGAVLSEVFRAGFAAIHHGQREAALATGMTPWATVRYVILPQTWRITLAPIGNYAIALLKDTAVVSAIAAPELMYRARNLITATFETTAVYVLVAIIYFCLSFPLARLVDHLEKRQKAWQ